MLGGVQRSVRPIASRAAGRSGLGVRMCVRDPRHRDRVQLEACAAERHPWGHVSLEDVCAAGCAVQEGGRMGRQWVRCARSTRPLRSGPCYVLCGRAARIRSLATSREVVGKLLLLPHSTAQAAACRFVEERDGAGGRWSRVRWSRGRCGRLRCSASGSSAVVGRGHGCGQRTEREAMDECLVALGRFRWSPRYQKGNIH